MAKNDKSTTEEGVTIGLLAAHAVSVVTLVLIVKEAAAFSNVTEALAFYGVYHREPGNQLIHFFGVPGILWSGIIFLVCAVAVGDASVAYSMFGFGHVEGCSHQQCRLCHRCIWMFHYFPATRRYNP